MNKHMKFAKKEWVWLFLDGYRPSEYAFEVSVLEHAKEKHFEVYRQKLAEARAKYDIEPDIEPEIEEEVAEPEEK